MSDVSKIVKNRPGLFAKPTDISKTMAIYSFEPNSPSQITLPRERMPFTYGGRGGVPIYYDKENNNLYVDHSDKHSIIIGSTASKKSRLVSMPMVMILGAAKESMIISDPKAEIYLRTADYLNNIDYNIQVLNLREPQFGSAWNPLYVPYLMYKNGEIDRAYEFANDIAINLTSIDKSEKEAFWDNSAGSFLFGLILLLFKYCKEHNEPVESVNISNIIKLRNELCSTNVYNPRTRNNTLWNYAKSDYFIASTLIGTVETANDTRAGILSTFDQKMRAFYINPSLLSMLSHNTIEYESLIKKPTAVFLIMPDEKTGYHNLVSLFVKQSYEYLIFEAQAMANKSKTLATRINYILDEFSSLPKINDFPAMITAARSRNIRFNLFLQSKHQMKLRYREETETIMSNCENWFFLTSREIELLKEISDLCGTVGGSSSQPLLSVADLQRLDKRLGEVLLLCGRNKPFLSQLADIDVFEHYSTSNSIYHTLQNYSLHEISFNLPSQSTSFDNVNKQAPSTGDLDKIVKGIESALTSFTENELQLPEDRENQ